MIDITLIGLEILAKTILVLLAPHTIAFTAGLVAKAVLYALKDNQL